MSQSCFTIAEDDDKGMFGFVLFSSICTTPQETRVLGFCKFLVVFSTS